MKNQTLKNISDIRQLKIKLDKEEKDLKRKQDSLARIKIQRPLHLERIGKYLSIISFK
jgi:hypothetical protein